MKVINVNDSERIEIISNGSIGTIYKLNNTIMPPIAIKCIKNVKFLNELV